MYQTKMSFLYREKGIKGMIAEIDESLKIHTETEEIETNPSSIITQEEYAALTLGASAIGTGLIHGLVGWFYFLPYAKTKKTSTLRYNQKNYNISFKSS